MWATTAVYLLAARQQSSQALALVGVLSLAASFIAVWLFIAKRRTLALCALAFVCLGLVNAWAQTSYIQNAPQSVDALKDAGQLTATMVEDAQTGFYGTEGRARIAVQGGRDVLVLLRFNANTAPRFGDTLTVKARFSQPDFQGTEFYWKAGVTAIGTCYHIECVPPEGLSSFALAMRNGALNAFSDFPEDEASVLKALVCGYRQDLSGSDLYAAFKRCGLAHMVAVSGAHLVIVTSLVAASLNALHVPRRVSIFTLIGLMGAYLTVAAAPISGIRACIMASLSSLSFLAKRRPFAQNALGICLMAVIAVNPLEALSVSLALSALSTLGIILFMPLAQTWVQALPAHVPKFASDAFALTVCANIATGPISCALFNQTSLISPLANVICAPLFPLACGTGLITALLCPFVPLNVPIVNTAAGLPIRILCVSVKALAGIPYACVPVYLETWLGFVIAFGSIAILWAAWPQGNRKTMGIGAAACVLVLTLLVFAPSALAPDQIVMLDVDQGDAFLVRSRARTLLIDTGNHGALLAQALGRHGIAHLDAVLLTHADDDHCGSLDALRQTVDVQSILVARDMTLADTQDCRSLVREAQETAPNVEALSLGDAFDIGDFHFQVIWPASFTDGGGNADSLCLLATEDADANGTVDFRALFTGDIESAQLKQACAQFDIGCVDVLKVSHHGSKTGLDADLASRLSPSVALISCGANNRYGHPHQQTLDLLEAQHSTVIRTDEHGDVSCDFSPDAISITLQR